MSQFEGPIYVVPVTLEDVKGQNFLMGPTGSGKSAFIESLSPDQQLGISKDSLESVTQEIAYYRAVKLHTYGCPVILVDTPGFLDTKLSEGRITTRIRDTLDILCRSSSYVYVHIVYFQPITDIRMGGSKRDAVKLLRAFTESFQATGITVVTTMWNHISTPKQIEEATRRFSSLQNEIFVGSDTLPINVVKYEFSNDSALSILDNFYGGWYHDKDTSQNMHPQYQSLIQNNLRERITNIHQQLELLAEDKQDATTHGREDPRLLEVVLRNEKAALGALQSFLDDLYEIDPKSCRSRLPSLPLRVALKYRFRHFVVTGKRVFRKQK
ncbi:hypothetical protein BJ165DRAFT_1572198 [Panaeolus papilionaceus]|nr:hypothetical protein BJ165DRAFT_1572198 [Panaeolus papilionaceus]